MTTAPMFSDGFASGLIIICFFIIGACCGSFANAAALRLLRDEAVMFPASRCRFCARDLRPQELIPVVSWLLQAGRCHCRKQPLSRRYILVEICLAILFALYALILPMTMAIGFAIASIFVTIVGLTDLEALRLHPLVLLILGLIGMGFAAAGQLQIIVWPVAFIDALLGGFCGGAIPWVINHIYRLLRHQNGLGVGDIWLLGALGIWLGPLAGLVLLMLASIAGAFWGVSLMAIRRAALSSKLPFGCFIAAAFLLFPFYPQGLLL